MMEDRSGQVIIVAVLFFVLSWIAVILRVYCRGWIIRSFDIDDKLMIALLLFFTAYLITLIQGATYGIGRHQSDLTAEQNRDALMSWYICELLYIVSTCLLKVSLGYFLLRFAIRRSYVWILHVLMLGTVLLGTAYLFMAIFQCAPVSTFWEESPRVAGKCYTESVILRIALSASIFNCLADWSFVILPLFIAQSLSLPKRTHILALAILSFAAIGSIAALMRSVYTPTLLNGEDFLWSSTDVAIWSTVEPGIGIIAASVATLCPLWQMLWYRAGANTQVPHAVARHKRSQGKSSYNRSEDSGGRRQHERFPIEEGPFEEYEAGIHPDYEAGLTQNHYPEDTASLAARSRRSRQSRRSRYSTPSITFHTSFGSQTETRAEDDEEELVAPRSDKGSSQWLPPSLPEQDDFEQDLEYGLNLLPMPPAAAAASPAPTVNWVSPRMSAISMGFNGGNGEPVNPATSPGFGEAANRASRLISSTNSHVGESRTNTYRDSRATTVTRNSRYDRYSRTTRTSSYHSRFRAPQLPDNIPLPNPPPPTWQVSAPSGLDSALWLSSRMGSAEPDETQ